MRVLDKEREGGPTILYLFQAKKVTFSDSKIAATLSL